jgi:hypothetical protein
MFASESELEDYKELKESGYLEKSRDYSDKENINEASLAETLLREL